MNWVWSKNKGQSILEVILALAIFALFASAMVSLTLGSFEALGRGDDYLRAAALADEALEAARAIRDGAWNELTVNQSAATSTSGEWQFAGEGTDEQISKFHRVLSFSPVCRDSSLNLTICPTGAADLHSRAAKVMVDWTTPIGTVAAVERQTLFTNWDSRDWLQTDWSGGDYASADPTIDVTAVGELKLKAKPMVWNSFASPVTQILNSVHCRASNDCFAVGNAITAGPPAGRGELILYWDGVAWTRVGPLAAVPNINLNSVFCLPSSDCWAVGAVSSGEVIIRSTSGTGWTRVGPSAAVPDVALNSIFCLTTSDCWAVGAVSGGEVTIRWNGTSWTRVGPSASAPDVALNSVFCLTASNCFATGASGNIISWNGTNWSLSANTGAETWNDVFMLSATNGFVAGSGGSIRRWNGSNWNTAYAAGVGTWNEIEMISASDGLVVGAAGASRRFNGSTWSAIVSNTTQAINSLVLTSPRTGWAVGASGVILRLTGGGFEQSGLLTSSVFDMGDPSPVQIIEWDEQIPVCVPVTACSIKFQIRVADNPTMTGAVWPTPPFNFTASGGTLINQSYNGKRYAQYQVSLNGDGASTPVLEEVRINYK